MTHKADELLDMMPAIGQALMDAISPFDDDSDLRFALLVFDIEDMNHNNHFMTSAPVGDTLDALAKALEAINDQLQKFNTVTKH